MNAVNEDSNARKGKPHKSNNETKCNKSKIKSNVGWTCKNKEILLDALKKHGPENIEDIAKMLPNIPNHEIKSKISEYSERAKGMSEDELLNIWLNCGLYKSNDSLVPQALLLIQLFEKHPSPSESDGYDLRAIYNFLYRSCLEETAYFDLSPKDKDLLCFLLSRTQEKLWPKYQAEVLEYIGRIYNRRDIKRVYPGKDCSFNYYD